MCTSTSIPAKHIWIICINNKYYTRYSRLSIDQYHKSPCFVHQCGTFALHVWSISIFIWKQFQGEYYPAEASTKLSYSPEINYCKNNIPTKKFYLKKIRIWRLVNLTKCKSNWITVLGKTAMNHDNYSIHKLGPKFKHFFYNASRWVFSLPVPPK